MLPLFDRNRSSPVALPIALDLALTRGATVLTANVRAARALAAAHSVGQRTLVDRDGLVSWPTPRIHEWKSWVSTLWDQYSRWAEDAPLPLSAMQEHQLWKQVQGADRNRVVAPERMAELAQEAYALLGDYQAHRLREAAVSSLFGGAHEDVARFLAWAGSFDRLCETHGWIARSRLEERLAQGVAELRQPAELVLVGFDRTTPAQAALLAALASAGTNIWRWETPAAEPAENGDGTEVRAFADPRAELEACARWCRGLLDEGLTGRIGVIVPDLGRFRGEMERVFRRVLMPQTVVWAADPGGRGTAGFPSRATSSGSLADPPLPYEFSLGAPLAQVPVVRAALLMLRWVQAPLASAELTWLLTSGFLAVDEADQLALARLDAELRQAADAGPQVALAWMLDRRRSRQMPGGVRTRLERVLAWATRERLDERTHAFAHWAELASAFLSEAGWSGFRTPDSAAYQVRQRWERLLAETAELGFDGSQPSWREFLHLLEEEAAKVIFAAESLGPPIQILGAFESSGQNFDAVWFLGVDDRHWPAVGRPHPLLPAWLQRDAGMPHATPEADWLLAQEATRRILTSAPVVVLSYPAQGQGVSLRASPLLPVQKGAAASEPGGTGAGESLLRTVTLESIVDDSGRLPWPVEQSAGGAEVLKRQAACAFQSFATRRLAARPLEDAEAGLDAAERGTLMHEVLERLWSITPGVPMRLHDRGDLERAVATDNVAAMVTYHIDAAFAARAADKNGGAWQAAYLACERERVLERVMVWLECELARRPFTVTALEIKVPEIQVGKLRLNVRPDRIDTLADGSRLLLDYKTGKVAIGAWDGARPAEPQLPLYAVFGNVEAVSGVAFAQIRADGTKLLVRAEDVAAQVAPSLGAPSVKNRFDDEVRDDWRNSLAMLAADFVSGDARVNPREGAKTCKWCPLAGLCRVHALRAIEEEDDDALDA